MTRLAYPTTRATRTPWLWPWAAAVAVFAAMGLVQHMDAQDAQAMAADTAHAAKAAHASAKAARRTELAAASLCIKTHGMGARHGWTDDGSIVCTRMQKVGA